MKKLASKLVDTVVPFGLGLLIGIWLTIWNIEAKYGPIEKLTPNNVIIPRADGGATSNSYPHITTPRDVERYAAIALRTFFDAVASVESGGDDTATGDNGRSIGRYQIGKLYWIDSGYGGTWERCRDASVAEAIMLRYWKRWCPDALTNQDWYTLARIHNGGPRGNKKLATISYADKVIAAMMIEE